MSNLQHVHDERFIIGAFTWQVLAAAGPGMGRAFHGKPFFKSQF